MNIRGVNPSVAGGPDWSRAQRSVRRESRDDRIRSDSDRDDRGRIGARGECRAGGSTARHQRVPGARSQRGQRRFIEIYNNSGADHTVVAGSGTGYGVAASDGSPLQSSRTAPSSRTAGTICASTASATRSRRYPAGNGTTATGDATYTTDIPDNAGIAIFNNNVGGGNFTAGQPAGRRRLDQRGEHALQGRHRLPGADPVLDRLRLLPRQVRQERLDHDDGRLHRSARRRTPTTTRPTSSSSTPNGTSPAPASGWARPGRRTCRRRSSATPRFAAGLLDTCVGSASPPNRVRDFTSDPANNSTFGTLDIRRTFTNNTGGTSRAAFPLIDLTTFPAPSGIADLRPRTSTAVVVTVDRPPCGIGHHRTSPCRARRSSSRRPAERQRLQRHRCRPARSRWPRRSPTAPRSTCASCSASSRPATSSSI